MTRVTPDIGPGLFDLTPLEEAEACALAAVDCERCAWGDGETWAQWVTHACSNNLRAEAHINARLATQLGPDGAAKAHERRSLCLAELERRGESAQWPPL
jgi:hypothetical protein